MAAAKSSVKAMELINYNAKTVDFGGGARVILYPPSNADEPCPLLALANALLLKGVISISLDSNPVSKQHVFLRLSRHYGTLLKQERRDKKVISKKQINDTLIELTRPIDISVDPTRVDGIRSDTVGLQVFEHMGIPLYHTRILGDPDATVAPAVGSNYHVVFRADSTTTPVGKESEEKTVVDLSQGTGLTTSGLQRLHDVTNNDEICVVFWNNCFNTIVKHDGILYLLDLGSFSKDHVWKEFKDGDNGQLCNSNFMPVVEVEAEKESTGPSLLVRKYKCGRGNCALEFSSEINKSRHEQVVHSRDHKSKTAYVTVAELSDFWKELSPEDASKIVSISTTKVEGIDGKVLCRATENLTKKIKPGDQLYSSANRMKAIIESSQNPKISLADLFAAIDEASEQTAFRTYILSGSEKTLFGLGIKLLLEPSNVLASCSYFIEKNLVASWFDYREREALKHARDFFQEDETGRQCGLMGCTMCFRSNINFNRHRHAHSTNINDFSSNTDHIGKFWDDLTVEEARQILSLIGVEIEGFKGRKLRSSLGRVGSDIPLSEIARQLKYIMDNSEKTTSKELFAVLDRASEGTLFCNDISSCSDAIIFEGSTSASPTLSNLLGCVSYMMEKKLVQKWFNSCAAQAAKEHERSLVDEEEQKSNSSKADSMDEEREHGQSCSEETESLDVEGLLEKRILLEDFVKKNKLTKIHKLRRKRLFMRLKRCLRNKKVFKLSLVILTAIGRKCARGFMRFIIDNHRKNKCWNGDWSLCDMVVSNGDFVISKEPTFELTSDRVAADFDKYFEFMMLFYCNNDGSYPLYFEELQTDFMKIPDPQTKPDQFQAFEIYLSMHFAFMPLLGRSSLITHLYKTYESMRVIPPELFDLSDLMFPDWREYVRHLPILMFPDWREYVRHLPIFEEVYFYGLPNKDVDLYRQTYFGLLKFCRHFIAHDMDHTKVGEEQLISDMAVTELVLSQLLACHIVDLVWKVVSTTKMEGRFFNIFQAFETSDGAGFYLAEDDSVDISGGSSFSGSDSSD